MESQTDIEVLRGMFSYDPATGDITWKKGSRNGRNRAGGPAGCLHKKGYRRIKACGRLVMAHRIAWALHYGEWPAALIDHRNGLRDDNRIENLRLASASENIHNGKMLTRNRTGFRGVYPSRGQFAARISKNKKRVFLGLFKTPDEAHAAYMMAARDIFGGFACDGRR